LTASEAGARRIVLASPRLELSELAPGDIDFVAGMLADPEVMRFYPEPLTREQSLAWIERQRERYARDGHALWLVSDRATGEPVGQVGLILQDVEGRPEPEVGYLVHRPYWRRGYASEAARAVRDWAFERRGIERVISLIRPANAPSQAVARRLGMTPGREVLFHGLPHLVFAVSRA
jgi:RimJ/RimL family protein N-acetyltransferase